MAEPYDLAVVGGGPGGYTAAIRAAQLGMRTVLVERDKLGGVCGNWGCIPSKAILRSAEIYDLARCSENLGIVADGLRFDYERVVAHSREAAERVSRGVQTLMKKNRIDVVMGEGRIDGEHHLIVDGKDVVEANRILLAAGSAERLLPGIEIDPPRVTTSRELLAETTLPASVVIVGGGAIGVEFGYVFACLGVEVTIVELERHLLPGVDEAIARELQRSFSKRGVTVKTQSAFTSLESDASSVTVRVRGPKGEEAITAERCIVAVGRRPRAAELGLAEAGIAVDRGLVRVNERYETSVPHVLAIGDLIDSPPLAHVASAEGIAAVEIAAGRRAPGRIDALRIPACVYCHPEIATIGRSEAQAKADGYDVRCGTFAMRALGRAVASGELEGMVKVVTDARTGELLGCHVIGGAATEVIAEAAMLMGLEGTIWDMAHTVHAHPTFSEGAMEAALNALGEGLSV